MQKKRDGDALTSRPRSALEQKDCANENERITCQRIASTVGRHVENGQTAGPAEKSYVDDTRVVHEIHVAITKQKVGFRNGWISANAVRALIAPTKIGPQKLGDVMRSMGFSWNYRVNTTDQERDAFPDAGDKTMLYTNTERSWRPCVIAAEYDAAQRTVDDPRAEL